MENNVFNGDDLVNNHKGKINVFLIVIILILLVGVGYLSYINYYKDGKWSFCNNNASAACDNSNTTSTTSYSIDIAKMEQVERKISNMFFWIKDNKVTDMNKLDNDFKLCVGFVSYDPNKGTFTNNEMDTALKNVFGKTMTVTYGDVKNASDYGMDCIVGIAAQYDSNAKQYTVSGIGFSGVLSSVEKKLIKVEVNNNTYNLYYKAVYRDDNGKVYANSAKDKVIDTFKLMEDNPGYYELSNNNKTLDQVIDQGDTYKLTFENKNNEFYWTGYEDIK